MFNSDKTINVNPEHYSRTRNGSDSWLLCLSVLFTFPCVYNIYVKYIYFTYLKFLRDEFEKGNEGWGDIKLNLKSLHKFKLSLQQQKYFTE